MAQEKEKLGESVSRLGRFAGATEAEKKKKQPDMVGRIQAFGRSEMERKKKEDAEKKKKASEVKTAPPAEEGFLTRMYKKYIGGGSK